MESHLPPVSLFECYSVEPLGGRRKRVLQVVARHLDAVVPGVWETGQLRLALRILTPSILHKLKISRNAFSSRDGLDKVQVRWFA